MDRDALLWQENFMHNLGNYWVLEISNYQCSIAHTTYSCHMTYGRQLFTAD